MLGTRVRGQKQPQTRQKSEKRTGTSDECLLGVWTKRDNSRTAIGSLSMLGQNRQKSDGNLLRYAIFGSFGSLEVKYEKPKASKRRRGSGWIAEIP